MKTSLAFVLTAFSAAAASAADFAWNGVFADHMVLQRDKPVRVWGTAASAGRRDSATAAGG